ncbi:MAG: hydrogenase maturation peptidase HycI [Chloroflexi bacterium]|nr:hydrogenase maturation peptidase HycI [Chloroflexota bacterium]
MGGTIVLGIGNRLGGDDAAGTYVVEILNRKQRKAKAPLPTQIISIVIGIDAGTAPESYTSVIRQHRPDLLILVDAANMGLPPGALRIIPPEKIKVLSFSTHHMPLSMFMSYVEEFCGKVVLVGVQPERTDMGRGISKAVRQSVKKLAEAILEGRVAEIPLLE